MAEKKEKSGISMEALTSLDAPVSFWKGIPFGLQHVMAMFVANLAPIFIVASAAKMNSTQSAAVIQAGLLVAGLGTCLQLYGAWRIGSRLPMVTGISFTYVAAACAICSSKGYGAVVGAVMVGGLLELVLGLTAKYWRRFVPPIVSAIVVTSIGFSLLTVGATSFGGGSGAKDFGSWQNLTLGLISLVACLAFQLLMKGTAKQLSVLFGLVVGYVVAICMGKVDFSGFQHLAIFSLPQFMPFKPVFDPGSIISLALLYVVSSVEVLGDTAALTKVGLNRLPTERETAGAIAGDGAGGFAFSGQTVQADLGQRGGIAQYLDRRHHVQQCQGDDGTRVEYRLERHKLRQGKNGQMLESGEIDLAHADGDHIADHQAEKHGQLLGGSLHEQLECEAGDQGDQTERQILPGSEILGAAAAAEARGADGKQGEAD